MAKGKGKRSPEKSASYKSNSDRKKAEREKKRVATRERWANDKEYLKRQEANGYEKRGNKWVKKTNYVEAK